VISDVSDGLTWLKAHTKERKHKTPYTTHRRTMTGTLMWQTRMIRAALSLQQLSIQFGSIVLFRSSVGVGGIFSMIHVAENLSL